MLINLVKNAIEAIEDGPRRTGAVTVTVAVAGTCPGAPIEVSVRDDGCGIPADQLATIFIDPFFTTKTRDRGTGLGLAVVRQIVDAHGGVIAVTSAPGAGTRFAITLPAASSRAA